MIFYSETSTRLLSNGYKVMTIQWSHKNDDRPFSNVNCGSVNNTSIFRFHNLTKIPQFTHLDIKLTKMIFKKYTSEIFAYHSMCRDYIYLVPLFIDSTKSLSLG